MALISNKHAGIGLAVVGAALIPFSLHEARDHLDWVHDKLWIAGPMLIVLGITMARHPGSGPVGDDNEPSLTRRERVLWIIGGALGLVAGVGWQELLSRM
jgi:hypothetical protein